RIYLGLTHAAGLIELKRRWEIAAEAYGASTNQSTSSVSEALSAASPKVVTTGAIIQSISSLLLLADRPELLARGIVELLDATGVAIHTTATIDRGESEYDVIATAGLSPEGHDRQFLTSPTRLSVGAVDGQQVEVWLQQKDDIESIATLNAVRQLLS